MVKKYFLFSDVSSGTITCVVSGNMLTASCCLGRSFADHSQKVCLLQGGSNMTGTSAACLHKNQSRSYLNHLVHALQTIRSRITKHNNLHNLFLRLYTSKLSTCLTDYNFNHNKRRVKVRNFITRSGSVGFRWFCVSSRQDDDLPRSVRQSVTADGAPYHCKP